MDHLDSSSRAEADEALHDTRFAGYLFLGASLAAYILWNSPWRLLQVLSAFVGLGAGGWLCAFVFHGSTYLTLTAAPHQRRIVQMVLVVVTWLIPFLYFASSAERSLTETLRSSSYPWIVGVTFVLGSLAFTFVRANPTLLPIRSFLMALAGVSLLCLATLHGVSFSSEEDGVGPTDQAEPSPDRAYLHYVLYSAGAFTGITLALTRRTS